MTVAASKVCGFSVQWQHSVHSTALVIQLTPWRYLRPREVGVRPSTFTCGLLLMLSPDGVDVVKPQRFRQRRGEADLPRHMQVAPRSPLPGARLGFASFLLGQLAPRQLRHLRCGRGRCCQHRRVALSTSSKTTDVIDTWRQSRPSHLGISLMLSPKPLTYWKLIKQCLFVSLCCCFYKMDLSPLK